MFEIDGQSINPYKVSKITPILNKKKNNKDYYYFLIHLSGNTRYSNMYESYIEADTIRTNLINQVV
jgi:hypothetical protein